MSTCPKCGGPIGKSSPEHTEIECLNYIWMPGIEALLTPIPTHPTIFGGLRLIQLHISGAVYHAAGDAPSVPSLIVLTNKTRRWELVISDAYETDRTGKPLNRSPMASTAPTSTPSAEMVMVSMKDYQKVLDLLGEERAKLAKLNADIDADCSVADCGRPKELLAELAAERKLSADRLVAYDIANTTVKKLEAEHAQDWRIISDQQAELARLRSNHNLTDKETNHAHAQCPCTVPPTPHCQWCGAKMDTPKTVLPTKIVLGEKEAI